MGAAAAPGGGGPASAGGSVAPGGGVLEVLREMRRFARGILGSGAYDKYLHHHRITGCAAPPLTEREFWRQKYDEQDANPGARCC